MLFPSNPTCSPGSMLLPLIPIKYHLLHYCYNISGDSHQIPPVLSLPCITHIIPNNCDSFLVITFSSHSFQNSSINPYSFLPMHFRPIPMMEGVRCNDAYQYYLTTNEDCVMFSN